VNGGGKTVAMGGGCPMGAPQDLLEAGFGPGQRYDPSRDVLIFWKYMMAAVMETMRTRRIPILEEFNDDPDLERRVIASYSSLVSAMGVKHESYDELVTTWCLGCNDPEAMDIIMKLFGRAIMQFYIECCIVRGIPVDQVWPLGMDYVIRNIMASSGFPHLRVPLRLRIRRAWRAVINIFR